MAHIDVAQGVQAGCGLRDGAGYLNIQHAAGSIALGDG